MERAVLLLALAAGVAGNLSKLGVISEIKALETHLDVSAHTTSKLQAAEAAGALGTRWRDTKLESYPLGPHRREGQKVHTYSQPQSIAEREWYVIVGFFMGIVFFILSFPFLFFVEGEVCKAFVMMSHAKKACQKEISADRVQRKYQNCMVHVTGHATTETGQRDEDFGFTPAEK
jgi:hypothetical protein